MHALYQCSELSEVSNYVSLVFRLSVQAVDMPIKACTFLFVDSIIILYIIYNIYSAAVVQYLQQQRVLADPLNGGEKVALQGNICAFLPSEQHTVLNRKGKTNNIKHRYTPRYLKYLIKQGLCV